MTRVWFLLTAMVFAAPAAGQEPVKLSEVDLPLEKLKNWGTKEYTYRSKTPGREEMDGEGVFTLKTMVEGNVIVLDDRMKLTWHGKEISLHLVHRCRKDSYLSPVRIESEGEGEETGTFVVEVNEDGAVVKFDGEERPFELPNDTVTF